MRACVCACVRANASDTYLRVTRQYRKNISRCSGNGSMCWITYSGFQIAPRLSIMHINIILTNVLRAFYRCMCNYVRRCIFNDDKLANNTRTCDGSFSNY